MIDILEKFRPKKIITHQELIEAFWIAKVRPQEFYFFRTVLLARGILIENKKERGKQKTYGIDWKKYDEQKGGLNE